MKPLPLPVHTARALLGDFRRARFMAVAEPRMALAWHSVAHQCQWAVKELRRANPRARRAAMRARSERVAAGPLPPDLRADLIREAS